MQAEDQNSKSSDNLRPPHPIRVLCVEDNQLVADAIERKLAGSPEFESIGWVNTAEQLMERLAKSQVHVVCMDLDIPGQDTLEMIRTIRDKHPESRVLVLTGRLDGENVNKSVDAGAWGFLSKADESREIVDAIRRVAAGSFVLGRHAQAEYQLAASGLTQREQTKPDSPRLSVWDRVKLLWPAKPKGTP